MKKLYFLFIGLLILPAIFAFAIDFPPESVMNFNPAYMVTNSKWLISYETYFGDAMDLVVFQPFQNGFAGEVGLYANGKTNGVIYSVASSIGKVALGTKFDLSFVGTSLHVNTGFGVVQEVWKNADLELRVPNTVTYIYDKGFSVNTNFQLALSLVFKNWNAAAFAGVTYPWVKTGFWGGISFLGAQLFGRYTYEYDSELSSAVNEQIFDLTVQYSVGAMKFAYMFENDKHSSPSLSTKTNGLRFTVEW